MMPLLLLVVNTSAFYMPHTFVSLVKYCCKLEVLTVRPGMNNLIAPAKPSKQWDRVSFSWHAKDFSFD